MKKYIETIGRISSFESRKEYVLKYIEERGKEDEGEDIAKLVEVLQPALVYTILSAKDEKNKKKIDEVIKEIVGKL